MNNEHILWVMNNRSLCHSSSTCIHIDLQYLYNSDKKKHISYVQSNQINSLGQFINCQH